METGVERLLEASVKLECNLDVTNRALLLYHQFMRTTAESHCYSPDMVAAAALNLSGSFSVKPIDIDSLICVFYSSINDTLEVLSTEDVAYKLMKRTLTHIDFVMVRALEFDFNHRLAHQYLVPFLLMICKRSKNVAVFQAALGRTSLRFMNDFYTQQMVLDYAPEVIAIACIDLALYIHGLVNDVDMILPWYMGFVADLTPNKIEEMKKNIMKIYEPLAPTGGQQVMPGQVMPGQVMPGQVMPGQVMPGQVMPGQIMPGQIVPGQIRPGQIRPGQIMPIQIKKEKL